MRDRRSLAEEPDHDLRYRNDYHRASEPASLQHMAHRPEHQPYLAGGSRVARAQTAKR
jgi:hypothetical protein